MKALVFYGNKDIRFESNWREPNPAPGEVKLRMAHTSICATDIEQWQHGPLGIPGKRRTEPLVLGHEAAGYVAEVGEGVTDFKPGDRVAVMNVLSCEQCYWCHKGERSACANQLTFGLTANGGLAEYAAWPAHHVLTIPDHVPDEEAPLNEPTAVAVHGARRANVRVDDNVVVLGCGTVGLLTVQVMKASGARVIAIDRRQQSLDMAAHLGADETIDASKDDPGQVLPDLTHGIGPDIVMETSGATPTPISAIEWVRRRGKVVLVGLYSSSVDMRFNRIVMGEREVFGSVSETPEDYRTALNLIASGKVKVAPLISAQTTLERAIPEGFERMLKPEKDVFRIVVGAGA